MTTIKIKPSHPSQGDFVLIEKKDFDPSKHELIDGESLGDEVQGDGTPTLAELVTARNQLMARADELDDRELQLSQRAIALDDRELQLLEREQANAAEAQRLADEKAALGAATAPNGIAGMSKGELQAALKEKGIPYPSSADKADLVALLTAP